VASVAQVCARPESLRSCTGPSMGLGQSLRGGANPFSANPFVASNPFVVSQSTNSRPTPAAPSSAKPTDRGRRSDYALKAFEAAEARRRTAESNLINEGVEAEGTRGYPNAERDPCDSGRLPTGCSQRSGTKLLGQVGPVALDVAAQAAASTEGIAWEAPQRRAPAEGLSGARGALSARGAEGDALTQLMSCSQRASGNLFSARGACASDISAERSASRPGSVEGSRQIRSVSRGAAGNEAEVADASGQLMACSMGCSQRARGNLFGAPGLANLVMASEPVPAVCEGPALLPPPVRGLSLRPVGV